MGLGTCVVDVAVRLYCNGEVVCQRYCTLPYEEETVRAGQQRDGETGSDPALGGRDGCSFPKAAGTQPGRRQRDYGGTRLTHAMPTLYTEMRRICSVSRQLSSGLSPTTGVRC